MSFTKQTIKIAQLSMRILYKVITLIPAYREAVGSHEFKLGYKARKAENYLQAIDYLKIAASLKPKNIKYLSFLALTLAEVEKYDEAIEFHKECLKVDPNYKAAWRELAYCYRNLKRYKEAIKIYRDLSQKEPYNGYYLEQIGICFFELELYEEAIESLVRASAIDPDLDSAYYYIAESQVKLGLLSDAELYYLKAIYKEPELALNHFCLGALYYTTGRYEESKKYFHKALNLDPENEDYKDRLDEVEAKLIQKNEIGDETFITGPRNNKSTRYIIDGSNICFSYLPQSSTPSLALLLSLLVGLLENDFSFLCFFDANTRHKLRESSGDEFSNLIEYLTSNHSDHFVEVPGGTEADEFILETANTTGESIISNDRYRDRSDQYNWIEKSPDRLLKGTLVNNRIMIPSMHLDVALKNDHSKLLRELEIRFGALERYLQGRDRYAKKVSDQVVKMQQDKTGKVIKLWKKK
jgi:tetratricopeptide (TPR) repeat protein